MESGIFLLLGTNLGDRNENLLIARQRIEASAGQIMRSSSRYETAAWGNVNQPGFYNQVIEIKTRLSPGHLLKKMLIIENDMGRKREEKWGPRIIDIDILFFNNEIIDRPDLKIPHPGIPERKFTLAPLAEIAPEFLHPMLGKDIKTLLKDCPDASYVHQII